MLAHPEPTNISELQAFLGTVNFYRRFLPAAAKILKPLTDLLVGGAAAGRFCGGQGRPGGSHLSGAPFPRFPAQPQGGCLC
ncbi:MAG: hypothetical protein ACK559_32955 [bacterium]